MPFIESGIFSSAIILFGKCFHFNGSKSKTRKNFPVYNNTLNGINFTFANPDLRPNF